MDDLDRDDLKVLVNFYRQKSNDLEWANLTLQLKLNKHESKDIQDTLPDF
jgi:hypothetical protein